MPFFCYPLNRKFIGFVSYNSLILHHLHGIGWKIRQYSHETYTQNPRESWSKFYKCTEALNFSQCFNLRSQLPQANESRWVLSDLLNIDCYSGGNWVLFFPVVVWKNDYWNQRKEKNMSSNCTYKSNLKDPHKIRSIFVVKMISIKKLRRLDCQQITH